MPCVPQQEGNSMAQPLKGACAAENANLTLKVRFFNELAVEAVYMGNPDPDQARAP